MRMKSTLVAMLTMVFSVSVMASPVSLVVDFDDDVTMQEVTKLEKELGIDVIPNSTLYSKTKITNLEVDETRVQSLLEALSNSSLVENVEEDVIYKALPYVAENSPPEVWGEVEYQSHIPDMVVAADGPNDPLYKEGKQWNMTMIGVEKAWEVSTGKGVVVAVLDTGVSTGAGKYLRVPDLKETCMVEGYNFVNNNTDAYDWHGHGTHVSGTIAQSTNNGIGVVGVAHKACIMPVKVLSDEGYGSTADIAEAIIWAADHGAHVINMSLGGGGHSKVMASALKYAAKNNVFVACAAGNAGTGKIEYPAAMDGCLAVSSVGMDGNLAFYSSYGRNGGGLFIAAPGGDQRKDGPEGGVWQDTIVTGKPNQHGYFPFQGTSMATPHVAGAAALVISKLGPTSYKLADVEEILSSTTVAKSDKARYGSGILNVGQALTSAQEHKEGGTSYSTWFLSLLLTLASLGGLRKVFSKD